MDYKIFRIKLIRNNKIRKIYKMGEMINRIYLFEVGVEYINE
jgi:hypothetical protein